MAMVLRLLGASDAQPRQRRALGTDQASRRDPKLDVVCCDSSVQSELAVRLLLSRSALSKRRWRRPGPASSVGLGKFVTSCGCRTEPQRGLYEFQPRQSRYRRARPLGQVLTRAARASEAIEIVSGFSRSEESRADFQKEFGVKSAPDLATLLANAEIKGVILTVPNEQHLPLAREVAKAGKHVYTKSQSPARWRKASPSRRWRRPTASASRSATARG